MARDKVDDNARLARRAGFRLSEADWQAYRDRVRDSGLTPSEFFRKCVLTNRTQIIARAPASGDRKQLLYAVNKVGNNLNQLAHAVNTAHLAGRVSEVTYLSVLDHLQWFQQYLKGLLDHVD
ncbi:plasmid mobilization protein [Burkholderia pseudomallei]|uniref:plasmid mobilization protein n=1 Tax=Burkholderia pseudomallei TaxID=28450 RepID=UPI000538A1F3|nr:plasmid mobilization relaxosome protein MobC [Burkholderia pseudomallei]KGV73979.1 bacterial mobilization family protein [Burkholderia pseudomallei MSHR4299]